MRLYNPVALGRKRNAPWVSCLSISVHIGAYPAARRKFRHSSDVKRSIRRPMAP